MNKKLLTGVILGLTVALGSVAPALADSRKVVTLGADLSEEQRQTMLRYFGVTEDSVDIIWIDNDDERRHLGNYVPLEQIGTRTFSCALVSPTRSGGIQVKTANLNWVTCNMIASTLSTSGVKNCQVVAASPFEVSGTGALTGVIMAYENAQDTPLEPVKVELANEELVTTANLSDEVGASKATAIINATKLEVIENNITDVTEITNIVNHVSNEYDVTINDNQSEEIAGLMAKIAQQEYDYLQLKATLDRVQANVAGDAGASEAVQKELEKIADKSEEAAYEAIAEGMEENDVVVAEDEEEDSILDLTDVSALEESGVVVIEGDTTTTVLEQEEENDTVTAEEAELIDIPEATGDDTVVAEEEVEVIDIPEATDDMVVIDAEDDASDEENDVVTAEDDTVTKDDLDAEDKEIFEEIEKGMKDLIKNDQVSDEEGMVVYLTQEASEELPKAVTGYVLNVLAKGAAEVAEVENNDPEISKNIMEETKDLAKDQGYDDEALKQIDLYVRRLVLKDSEKVLKESFLTEADSCLIYDEIMAVLEDAFDFEREAEFMEENEVVVAGEEAAADVSDEFAEFEEVVEIFDTDTVTE